MTGHNEGAQLLDGASVLDQVEQFMGRYIVFPDEHCLPVVTLFAAHTHAVECFYVTPRLILDSAEPESGKTRVLELLALFCHNPKMTFNTTVAALYRRLADSMLTVLLDEADAIWSAKSGPQAEELRAFVNSGYKRGATVDRCVGDASKMKVVEFPVFAPVAIAGLAGNMPPTVTTRGITIHMRRRAPGEHVDDYEEEDVLEESEPLRDRLSEWMTSAEPRLRKARPTMPAGVVDRRAEVWRALLAIADAAGGDWPQRARAACQHFALGGQPGAPSLGIRLLDDLKGIFGERDRMPTVEILETLCAIEEAPWGDLRGKPLDSRGLARYLKRYQLAPAAFDMRDGTGKTAKGYTTYPTKDNDGLADAWVRYLPPPSESGKERKTGKSPGQRSEPSDRLTDPSVRTDSGVAALTSELTEVTGLTEKCAVCSEPLHRFLIQRGVKSHPSCEGVKAS